MYRDQIRSIYAQFSPGYRRIADFILENYQDAAFMTAAEISRAARVDTALVVRFAQRLGYPGFPELINEVREHLKQDLRVTIDVSEDDNSLGQVLRRSLLQDRETLKYALQQLDEATLATVFELFSRAARIFVIGEDSAGYFAEALKLRLLVLGYSAHTVPTDLVGRVAVVAGFRDTDLIIGIGLTEFNPGVAAVLREARTLGAHTVGITPSLNHPVAIAAQYVLHAPVNAVGIMPSWTALAAYLNAITQALALASGGQAAEWALRTRHLLKSLTAPSERNANT